MSSVAAFALGMLAGAVALACLCVALFPGRASAYPQPPEPDVTPEPAPTGCRCPACITAVGIFAMRQLPEVRS